MNQWYEELFANYASHYDQESFTPGTKGEVDFIEQELNFDKAKTILDVGCGTGRHAIELAGRGYQVTGIDLSAAQLKRARQKADAAGVAVEFLQRDARDFDFFARFAAAIMLCEGGFSLMESDEQNFAILHNVSRSLKRGGRFIFNALNALFPLYHSVLDFLNANTSTSSTSELTFELTTDNFEMLVVADKI